VFLDVFRDPKVITSFSEEVGLLNPLTRITTMICDETGQDLVEYALIGGLIALACAATMTGLATAIGTGLGKVTASLT
jgi:pilus assembly protein Flp/PilA